MSLVPLRIVRTFLAARGLRSLAAWAKRARVDRQAIYQARHGRGISAVNLRKLARAVGESETVVRGLLAA